MLKNAASYIDFLPTDDPMAYVFDGTDASFCTGLAKFPCDRPNAVAALRVSPYHNPRAHAQPMQSFISHAFRFLSV